MFKFLLIFFISFFKYWEKLKNRLIINIILLFISSIQTLKLLRRIKIDKIRLLYSEWEIIK